MSWAAVAGSMGSENLGSGGSSGCGSSGLSVWGAVCCPVSVAKLCSAVSRSAVVNLSFLTVVS